MKARSSKVAISDVFHLENDELGFLRVLLPQQESASQGVDRARFKECFPPEREGASALVRWLSRRGSVIQM